MKCRTGLASLQSLPQALVPVNTGTLAGSAPVNTGTLAGSARNKALARRGGLSLVRVGIYCLLVWLLRNLEILRSWPACYTHSVCCRPFFYKLFFCTLPIAGLQCSAVRHFLIGRYRYILRCCAENSVEARRVGGQVALASWGGHTAHAMRGPHW